MGIFLLGLGAADSLGTWILLLGGAFLFWVGYSSIGDVAKSKDKIANLHLKSKICAISWLNMSKKQKRKHKKACNFNAYTLLLKE